MGTTQRLLVSGRVHQVGYRDWTVRHARALGLTGWVRNLSDGRVEIVAQGEDLALTNLVEACREGPRLAEVAHIEAVQADEKEVKGFTKRFTV